MLTIFRRRFARRGGYDLYLLDVVMAHMNGLDIARKIRERGDAAEILFFERVAGIRGGSV